MKHSCIMLSMAALITFLASAQNTPAAKKLGDAVARQPTKKTGALLKSPFGGVVERTEAGPAILFLNTQKRVSEPFLLECITRIEKTFRLPCKLTSTPSDKPIAAALKELENPGVATVIIIQEAAEQPVLLVAPENRWASVNITALGDKNVAEALLRERTEKEIFRAFGYAMGVANSNDERCLLKAVLAANDLDALTFKNLSPEAANKVLKHAKKLGINPKRTTTYRQAAKEGWAPAPTNDVQRAIWSEYNVK